MTASGRGEKSHRDLLDRIGRYRALAKAEGYRALLPLDALRAVVELHKPIEYVISIGLPGELSVTECAGGHEDGASWPCSTVEAVVKTLLLGRG